jgi:hypothetical protein
MRGAGFDSKVLFKASKGLRRPLHVFLLLRTFVPVPAGAFFLNLT